jgi:hypothetical protein
MTGTIHGGQNPINGATLTLYIAGLDGYGSAFNYYPTTGTAGTALSTTTSNAQGTFTFPTYTCPQVTPTATTPTPPGTNSDFLEYVVATGGDSGSGTNSAIALMAVLGGPAQHGVLSSNDICSTIKGAPPTLTINEETTAASLFALAQFYKPTASDSSPGFFGTPSTNYQGMISAFNIAGELVNLSTGLANTTFQPQGASIAPVGGSLTYTNDLATLDADKIALIADIIAACVNSSGPSSPGCSALFQYAVRPPTPATTTLGSSFTYPTAQNTMTAAYYMAVNPINATTAGVPNTTAMQKLYALPGIAPPYAYTEAQPNDWTISVVYSSPSYGGGTVGFISAPTYLSVDTSGYVVYLTGSTSLFNEAVGQLNPYGGVTSFGLGSLDPFTGYAIDSTDIGYTSRLGSTKNTYSLTGSTANKYNAEIADTNNSSTEFQPAQLASDGKSLFLTSATTSGSTGLVFQVPGQGQTIGTTASPFTTNAPTTTSPFAAINAGHSVSALTASSPIVADSASHLYFGAGSAVYQLGYSPTTIPTGASGNSATSLTGTFVTPPALAVDHSNNLWIANSSTSTTAGNGYLAYLPAGTTSVTSDTTGDGGVNSPAGVAIDGAGNVWVANSGVGTSFSGQSVSEVALVGTTFTPLSPSVGFVHTYAQPGSIAVDLSGNVWVANTGVFTNTQLASITAYQQTTSTMVTFTAANGFTAGENVTITGTGNSTFDGNTFPVSATGLTSSVFEIASSGTAGSKVTLSTAGTATGATPATSGSITCILGAASPVVTPIAKGIGAGTQGSLP